MKKYLLAYTVSTSQPTNAGRPPQSLTTTPTPSASASSTQLQPEQAASQPNGTQDETAAEQQAGPSGVQGSNPPTATITGYPEGVDQSFLDALPEDIRYLNITCLVLKIDWVSQKKFPLLKIYSIKSAWRF